MTFLTENELGVLNDFRAGYYDAVLSALKANKDSLFVRWICVRVLVLRKEADNAKTKLNEILPGIVKGVEKADCLSEYMLGVSHATLGKILDAADEKYGVSLIEKAAEQGFAPALAGIGWRFKIGRDRPRDFAKAYEMLSSAKEQGDVIGTYRLGLLLWDGLGCEKNLGAAVSCFKYAAKMKYPLAIVRLGESYLKGEGVEQDDGKAKELFNEAIDWIDRDFTRCPPMGYYWLGVMARDGRGGKKNLQEAYRWFRIAEERGVAKARYSLYELLKSGGDVRKDLERAWKWLARAVSGDKKDHRAAKVTLEILNADLKWLKSKVKALEAREAKDNETAFMTYKEVAESGCSEAEFELYLCYKSGLGVDKDEQKALVWLDKAVLDGSARAIVAKAFLLSRDADGGFTNKAIALFEKAAVLGDERGKQCYAAGCKIKALEAIVDGDEESALNWYKKSVRFGDAEAMYNYGALYEAGEIVKKNMDEAELWYHRAANLDYAPAQYAMSRMYSAGTGIVKDPEMASALLMKSAKGGFAEAQRMLGLHYSIGIAGYNVDRQAGFEWLTKAALQDDVLAVYIVGAAYDGGEGVERDVAERDRWWGKLKQLGTSPERMRHAMESAVGELQRSRNATK